MQLRATRDTRPTNPSNRFGVDYAAEARCFAALPYPIIDAHAHINGPHAVALYRRAAELFGVRMVVSQTLLEHLEPVRAALGDAIRFVAVPNYMATDRRTAHGPEFMKRIERYRELGAFMVKFWAAPRGIDSGEQSGDRDLLRLDSPQRVEAMRLAQDLGLRLMAHVADPDTWFKTKYADSARYGSKRDQYKPLEELLARFDGPWLLAHMAGWPEDLEFIDGLLARHANFVIDTSATKWMVRELSRHSTADLVAFLRKWRGRVLFGSDIVTADEHLRSADGKTEMAAKSDTPEEAFDLYASRYWALRAMFETGYDDESPISDPDLALVDPDRYQPADAPRLRGHSLPADILRDLYHDAPAAFLGLDGAGGTPG